jgi:hypothetical protein
LHGPTFVGQGGETRQAFFNQLEMIAFDRDHQPVALVPDGSRRRAVAD